MKTVHRTTEFAAWFSKLKDGRAVERVEIMVSRLAEGNRGDWKPNNESEAFELGISYGPGYRIYCTERGAVVVLLIGGNKRTQSKDIKKVAEIAATIED